jgi:shikimate kinase/3-dehydroquinate synthase
LAAPLTVCIGFMGAGKSTAAVAAARAVGAEPVDVDRLIEQRHGRSIPEIFAHEGEGAFRATEERVTLELLNRAAGKVLALGGGAVGHASVRQALRGHLVIWLDIGVEEAWRRCAASDRPLARDRAAFDRLYAEREPLYAGLADATVPADRAHAMGEVVSALAGLPEGARMLWAASRSGDYPAFIGDGLLGRFWPETVTGRRFLVSDGNVAPLYAGALEPVAGRITIMPGEQSKTVAHAEIVWTELARAGMTRQDVLVALGGGVVGDVAGFCAATYQRGVRYVQVPTSLVAQVDSAYGGKTGIDLAEAKNYVGAYHQPSAVIADPLTLRSLPAAEVAAGYAEVLKTALIAGGELWERIRAGAEPAAPEVIAACVRTKLRIVAHDERDAGLRQVLNLGHTVGHAIEAVTGFARYRHGEAVALGLLAALRLSDRRDLRDEVRELLRAHGLPTTLEDADPDAVVIATARDKKRVGAGPVPFVLLEAPGAPRAGCQVQERALIAAVRELAA